MYRSLDLRRRIEIDDDYVERRHLHPVHELLKAPMLLGYPNLLASYGLRVASDGLNEMLTEADVVLAREPWQAPYVLDNTDEETPVVFSSHNVETERFGHIEQPILAERVSEWVDRLESRAVEESDATICTSERDASIYRSEYDPGGPVLVAPNGTYEGDLREHYPQSTRATRVRRKYDIPEDTTVCLFMGSNYRPNVEAAEAVVDIAWQIREQNQLVHFLIMGSVGGALADEELPENVTTTGYIEEMFEAHFDAADIALNSMLSGGGTNIKLIDYFARSLPVISTPFGTRGIDVEEGRHLIVREIEKFPDAIEELAKDSDGRRQLGEAARKLAADRYTWEASSRKLRKQMIDLFGPF